MEFEFILGAGWLDIDGHVRSAYAAGDRDNFAEHAANLAGDSNQDLYGERYHR